MDEIQHSTAFEGKILYSQREGRNRKQMVALGMFIKHVVFILNKYLLFVIVISDFPIAINFG